VRPAAIDLRALPLFDWSRSEMRRVEEILTENLDFQQTFVRAWSLDSLATFATKRQKLMPIVQRYLAKFDGSSSKALQARARNIRARLKR
jgi:D-mannonate dehydratase